MVLGLLIIEAMLESVSAHLGGDRALRSPGPSLPIHHGIRSTRSAVPGLERLFFAPVDGIATRHIEGRLSRQIGFTSIRMVKFPYLRHVALGIIHQSLERVREATRRLFLKFDHICTCIASKTVGTT